MPHAVRFSIAPVRSLGLEHPESIDLTERGVAEPFTSEGHPSRKWVRVSDQQLWPELTREAHEFVGEPPVGGES